MCRIVEVEIVILREHCQLNGHESVVYGQGCQEGQIVNEDRGQGIVWRECIKKYAGPQPDVLEVAIFWTALGLVAKDISKDRVVIHID